MGVQGAREQVVVVQLPGQMERSDSRRGAVAMAWPMAYPPPKPLIYTPYPHPHPILYTPDYKKTVKNDTVT